MAELLTFAVQETLTRVISVAAQEFSLLWGLKSEIKKLRESLKMVEALLRDADRAELHGEAVKLWVKKLAEVAQLADDVLDDYGYEVLRRKVHIRNGIARKVQDFFSHSNTVVFRHKMAHQIKKINACLDELRKDASVVGLFARQLDPVTTIHDGVSSDRETYSILTHDERNIIGRDDVVEATVKVLIKSNQSRESDLSVLAIVGMGGLGKTTLAKSIYNESEISSHFDKKIWICVSNNFEVRLILRGILEALEPKNAAVQSIDVICNLLREELKMKRYILILDDVWNEDAEKWNILMSCLLRVTDTKGSRIVVTTRSDKVAKIVETLPRCDLRKLSDDECWLILKDRAVATGSRPIPEDQEEVGRKIAKKCGGVPLVAKVLGNIMRSKSNNGWISIMDSEIWDLPEEEDRIMSVLKLSFNELKSSSLKQCFAYCSMFIKDVRMEKTDLIQLWMAQGWLNSTQKDKEMEDKGDEYFNILAERSLFQDLDTDYIDNITCKMHDLVHDLAEHVSNMGNSRSLFSRGETLENTLLVRSLRVLNLYKADIDKLPSSIGNLTHLRYLNVMQTRVKSFPDSIGRLFYLETFKMPYHVEEFPKVIGDLINLRHIHFGKHAKVPATVLGRLTNLRSIPFLKLGEESGPKIEELGGLNYLRGTLFIRNLEHVRDEEEAAKAKLVDKKQIRKLTLSWSKPGNNVDNQDDVLEGLKPHCNLEILEIEGFMGKKLPSWLLLASNLKEITLEGCNNCERVPALGHLPNLIHVTLSNMQRLSCLGLEFYGYDQIAGVTSEGRNVVFPALRSLSIENAENLIDWAEAGTFTAFPCLEMLTLSNCKKLTSTPSRFPSLESLEMSGVDSGIPIATILSNEVTTLTELDIDGVQGLVSLPDGTIRNNQNLKSMWIYNCNELSCISPNGFDCCSALESLWIYNCPKLRDLPDGLLSPSLKRIDIGKCNSLVSIPLTPAGLSSLQEFMIDECLELSSLPDGLQYCTSLREINIYGCPKVTSIPIPAEGMPSLVVLKLDQCPELSSLPTGLDCCTSLVNLRITQCPKVTSIPIHNLSTTLRDIELSNVEDSLLVLHAAFTSLRRVKISDCQSSQIDLQFLISIQELLIWGCPNLEMVSGLDKLTFLLELNIHDCSQLTCLPSLDKLTFLRELNIHGCSQLTCLPSLDKLTFLRKLSIGDCSQLTCLPSLDKLTSLDRLSITKCSRLTSLPSGLTSLTYLKELEIGPFWEELDSFPAIQILPQLETLHIYGWPKLKSLPEQIQYLTSLKSLWISYFDGVEAIPDWLGNLTSLVCLYIRNCKNLMHLPSVQAMQRITKLNWISIGGCPLLSERCTEVSGAEWPKISHIQDLLII